MSTPSVAEVTYTLEIEPEDQPVRGHFASGDAEEDRKLEDEIIARLDRGDIEAWCYVRVTASITIEGQLFQGVDTMGGNSYESEAALRKALFDKGSDYDMKGEALHHLKDSLKASIKRGMVARKALKVLGA